MITSSPSAFQYSAEERDSIAIAAPAKLNDADWCALQQIAATCPSAISAFSIKKLAPIEQASKKFGQLLEKASLAPDRYCIWSPDISALLKLICKQPFHAPTKGQWKSKSKRSNRARPDVFDDFLMRFVPLQQPWRARGQRSEKPLRAFRHCRSRARVASGWL
jgi:hypothetical protein